ISYEKVSIYGKSGDEQDTAEDKAINDDSNNNNNTRGRRRNISKNEINKRKSFDLNLSSGLTHKNSGYKKMTTSKSTSSISKHLQQQHPQGQHSSNNSLVSLKSKIDEDRNEVKQLGIINDPCTVTRDEQSIVTVSKHNFLHTFYS
ncbi:unnamed protein product, partial [Trichobilharzia regenti]